MTSILESITAVIAPHSCVVCSEENNILCESCRRDLFGQVASVCFVCQHPSVDFAVCGQCRSASPLAHVWIGADYEGPVAKLIKAFKFERAKAAAQPLGKALAEVLPYLPAETIIVPLPTTNQRVRWRGFDQATLLAQVLSRETSYKLEKAFVRIGKHRQLGATRQQRLRQAEGAFRLRDGLRYVDRPVLLVDDVLTTGATLNAAAKILNAAGAAWVDAVVVARQPLPGKQGP